MPKNLILLKTINYKQKTRENGTLNFDLSFALNMPWLHRKPLFLMITEK